VAEADLKPAYLIVGADRPKIGRALHRLRTRVGAEAAETMSAREASGEDVVAACNALGLFGGGARLVHVEEVERWKAPDAKTLGAYLEDPAPGTVVVLTGEVKADGPLGKAIAKRGEVLSYDVSKRALPGWVAEQVKRLGARADRDACRALVDVVGDDLHALETEVTKLATWAGDEPIGVRDVERLVAGREPPIWELTDAWGRRDMAAVMAASESLLEQSEKPRRDEVMRVSNALARHVGLVRAAQALSAEGVRPRDAVGPLKIRSEFQARKVFEQAERFSVEELRGALVRLAELDVALKGGSRLAGDLELARALADITRAPQATGAVSR
jgi:DNA polymerase-3 subunit delta